MREKILFDAGWLFHESDIPQLKPRDKMPMYRMAKTENKRWGPAARFYNDRSDGSIPGQETCVEHWDKITLPHDFIIAQTPRKENNEALGFFSYGDAWYRKHFTLPESDAGRRICLYFEAVAAHCEVYVNGCLACRNFCGYTSFLADITDYVHLGEDNVVAVYVDASQNEGWWYAGGGIYRHVWLLKTDRVSVDLYGVYVHPERREDGNWRVPVETTVRNDTAQSRTATVVNRILDASGRELATAQTEITLEPYAAATAQTCTCVQSPHLWDTDDAYLHTVETTVLCDGTAVDQVCDRFGFRTIRFDADTGFFLNDRPVKIHGVCFHQDYGLTGKAVPDRVQRYKLRRMREMGANGFRAVHYPHSEVTMDALDEMGFLVMDETRWFNTNPEAVAQLEMLVRRDRNRPSVIMWSICNEEFVSMTENGRRIAEKLRETVRRLDKTRPVTAAIDREPERNLVSGVVDVIGINYRLDHFDATHEAFPNTPIISSENCATGTSRGWYLPDAPNRAMISAYDSTPASTFSSREKTHRHLLERPWVCGGYQWAGVEHRGECVWPRLCSQSGALDLYLQRKDAFYQNQSHWMEEPMVHILPHWNLEERAGEEIPVWVYTNCSRCELLLNGVSLGVQDVAPGGHAQWQVRWQPGTLTAVGYRDGAAAARDTVETTGPAVALRLRLEDVGVTTDDVAILTCDCVDAQGRHVPDAAPFVRFNCNELGAVAATGSDITDHIPPACPDRQMRAGLCSVLVKTGAAAGTLRVYAAANGLKSCRLDVEIVEKQ